MDWVDAGDYELSLNGACGAPTLRLGLELESHLSLALDYNTVAPKCSHIGVHLHCFYMKECEQILESLYSSFPPLDLIVTTDTLAKKAAIEFLLSKYINAPWSQRLEVIVVANLGRNVIPFLREGMNFLKSCTVALHLHTKRSPQHKDFGAYWLDTLLQDLIGNTRRVNAIISQFEENPNLGMVMPRSRRLIRPDTNWGANFDIASMLVQSIWPSRKLDKMAPMVFPAGMMFWFKPKALEPLVGAPQALGSIPIEPILDDGTALHAIERLITHCCEISGMDWALLNYANDSGLETDIVDNTNDKQISVWQPEPEAYMQGIANLFISHGKLRLGFDELSRERDQIAKHRDSLEKSLTERDHALAIRDEFVTERTRELEQTQQQYQFQLQAIVEHRDSLEKSLTERDHALAIRDEFVTERTRELEQTQQQYQFQLQAIVEHRDSLEKLLTEREGELRAIRSSLTWRMITKFKHIIHRFY